MAKKPTTDNPIEQAFMALRDAEYALTEAMQKREEIHEVLVLKTDQHSQVQGMIESLDTEIKELEARLIQMTEEAALLEREVEEQKQRTETAEAVLAEFRKENFTKAAQDRALRELRAAYFDWLKAVAKREKHETEMGFVKERIGSLTADRNAAAEKLAALADELGSAQADEKAADEVVDQKNEQLDAAMAGLRDSLGKAPVGRPIDPSLLDLIANSGRTPAADFLTLKMPGGSFDDLAEKALETLGEQLSPQDKVNEARDRFVAMGIATDIAKVTKRLHRTRLSRIRKAVLVKSYVPLLVKRLGGPRMNPEVAEDTIGLADSIIYDLDAPGGPVEQYARLLTDITVDAMRLDAGTGTPARQLIEVQIRSSI